MRRTISPGWCLTVTLWAPPTIAAQTADEQGRGRFAIDLPLVDAPYNFARGIRWPSMSQSLGLSTLFYEATHDAIARRLERRWLAHGAIILWDFSTVAFPLGLAWAHEEYHRAVMGRRGIDSFNDVYKLKLFSDVIAVSRVSDDNLVRLKRDHPAEQVRLSAAGIEGEELLMLELEKNRFFREGRSAHVFLLWLSKVGSAAYVASGTSSETNTDTDEMNREEGADVSRRDFTGHDFTAWVYDLHRASEPYSARGVHPSGVGIDRYIKPADLTAAETRFLTRQGRLQLLNFADPFLFGYNGLLLSRTDAPLVATARLRHMLTSFGYTVDVLLFFKRGLTSTLFTLHRYTNGERSFAGVEGEIVDRPAVIGSRTLLLSARLGAWQQPEDQRFRTRSGRLGGLASMRADLATGRGASGYAELEGKTAGWVAGNVYLGSNVSFRLGIATRHRRPTR